MNATLYRMEMPEHICPSGLKARALLQKKGISFEDNKLTSREQTDAFKQEHGVQTTPQVWIDGQRIGGFDDLKSYFGEDTGGEATTSYTPVIALFGMMALMAMAAKAASFPRPRARRNILLRGASLIAACRFMFCMSYLGFTVTLPST